MSEGPRGSNLVNTESLRALVKKGSVLEDTRVLMLGLPGSGKTTLLTRISKGDRAVHDMGNQKFKVRSLKADAIDLVVWDVGEKVYVDDYWVDYHADRVSGIIFVVDSTDPSRLPEARNELFKLLSMEKLQGMPLAIWCNKGEVDAALSVVKVSEALELHEVKRREFKAFRTSAVTDEGIQAALEWMVSQKWSRA